MTYHQNKQMSQKWNSNIQFPTDTNFVNRLTAGSFSASKSSGNPMVSVTSEVVSPQEVEIGGEIVNIAGVETTNYFVTTVLKSDKTVDEAKTADRRKTFVQFWERMGLKAEDINWDNVDTKPLLGKLALTYMAPDEQERRKNPTTAQIEAAKKTGKQPEGDVLKNPITGKPLVSYWPKVREFFGLSPQQDGMSIPY